MLQIAFYATDVRARLIQLLFNYKYTLVECGVNIKAINNIFCTMYAFNTRCKRTDLVGILWRQKHTNTTGHHTWRRAKWSWPQPFFCCRDFVSQENLIDLSSFCAGRLWVDEMIVRQFIFSALIIGMLRMRLRSGSTKS